MNKKLIEEKFNVFYNKLNQEYYSKIIVLMESTKKEKVIRCLLLVLNSVFMLISFCLIGVIAENTDSASFLVFCTLFLIAFFVVTIMLIMNRFTNKKESLNNTYYSIVYNSILESIDGNWEFYKVYDYLNSIRKPLKSKKTDYYEALFPKERGNLIQTGIIRNKINNKILEAMFILIEYYDGNGFRPGYRGLYFSILNNNNITSNIYIRSKTYNDKYINKLPFYKLNINNQNYDIYASDIKDISNKLINLINIFYELTHINCDITITENKIQVRFDIDIENILYPKKKIFNKNTLEKSYYNMFQIFNFIDELSKLLSNQI